MIKIIRTDSDNKDFIELVQQLDAYLAEIDGDEHAFYGQFNKTNKLKHVLVAYKDDRPVGSGALKEYDEHSMEIKRMYVLPEKRGLGIAGEILAELEKWADELSYQSCVLETGKRQPAAIRLYEKNGYKIIPNYGQYVAIDNSVCFKKKIS